MVNRHYKTVKSGIRKTLFANPFGLGKYAISPYMACGHGCLYCDGRAEKYYVDGDFSTDIVIRTNLPELLAAQLPKLREKAVVSIGSGITDVYQPVEAQEQRMVPISRIIRDNGFAASVFTKSDLILRDLDTWQQVYDRSGFVLFVSLAVADEEIRQIFEPGAASVAARLGVIRAFKSVGIPVGVLAIPLLPGITDTPGHLDTLYELLADAGADFVVPGGLTLRPGRQKDLFMAAVQSHYPDRLPGIASIYAENRQSGMPHQDYQSGLDDMINPVIRRYKLSPAIPHALFQGMMPLYDEIHILLWAMQAMYRHRGVDIRPLAQATQRYCQWLTPHKKTFNRRRSLLSDYVDRILIDACQDRTLDRHLGNARLARFISRVVLDRDILDPVTLKLIPA